MRKFIIACLVIAACRLLASYVFCTFDDAFISFRYAQNLVAGNGFVYNLHEKVLGSTAPLFALIAAIPLMTGISVPKFFIFFNLFCDVGSLYLLYRYVFDRREMPFILFSFLFALDPAINRIAAGGMEANLFLFLSLCGMVLYFNRRKMAAFLLLAMIYFLRPEAILLFSILLLYEWGTTRKIPWKYLLFTLLLIAPPLLFMLQYYGHVLPQSVIAKNDWPRRPLSDLIRNIFFPHFFNYILFPLAVTGMLKFFFRSGYLLLAGTWFIAYAFAYLIRGPWILNWYIYAMEAIELIFAALALEAIACRLLGNPAEIRGLKLLPLLALPAWCFAVAWLGRSGVEVHVYDELKKDFGAGRPAGGKVFFADDIGALGFYTGAYIYDDLALVTPEAMKPGSLGDRIRHVRPDFLFLYAAPGYVNLMLKDSSLSQRYRFVKRYSRSGLSAMPSANEPPSGYKQDYLLFERKESN